MMRGLKIPSLIRNVRDGSITLAYQQAKYSLIWLHGAGDSPDSYLPYFTHLNSPLYSGCRIRLISAPNKLRSPTAAPTPVWYDSQGDQDHISISNKYLHECFNEEMEAWKQAKQGKIPAYHRVYVGGMGQGASTALNYSYTAEPIPAGAIALSGSLLPQTQLKNLHKMPSLLMHGLKDDTIKEIAARKSYKQLLKVEYLAQYKAFEGLGHGVNLEELGKMREWLQESHQFIRKHYETVAK